MKSSFWTWNILISFIRESWCYLFDILFFCPGHVAILCYFFLNLCKVYPPVISDFGQFTKVNSSWNVCHFVIDESLSQKCRKIFVKVSAGESFCPSALIFFSFFFFDLFVFNLRLSLHWNEYHALFYYKFYSIKILFYSIILWLYCDITYARLNYAVLKLKKSFQNKSFSKDKKSKNAHSK